MSTWLLHICVNRPNLEYIVEKIVSYTSKLANDCKQQLQEIGLEPLAIPVSMEAPNMKLLKLPELSCAVESVLHLERAIFGESKIFGVIVPIEDEYWIRISSQVYIDSDDVKAFVDVVRTFVEKNKSV